MSEYEGDSESLSDEENWMDTGWTDGVVTVEQTHSAVISREESTSSLLSVDNTKDNSSLMNRMLLNDNKAGMDGLDKEKINQIIYEASKGSKYFENERKKEKQMNVRIEEQKEKMKSITEAQLQHGLIMADRLLQELEKLRDLNRSIVHIDMDAFYAAVEIQDNPSLKDKPMAVGSSSMLSTSNYHARKYGVRAAMPGFIGKKLCPDLTIVPLNFDKYTKVSKAVRDVLEEYDPNYCPLSLDEAYIDLSEHLLKRSKMSNQERTLLCRRCDSCSPHFCLCDLNSNLKDVVLKQRCDVKLDRSVESDDVPSHIGYTLGDKTHEKEDLQSEKSMYISSVSARSISRKTKGSICPVCMKPFPDYDVVTYGVTVEDAVREMRNKIEQRTRLTASAGIAPNRMLAKVASDKNKPNGQYRILPTKEAVMSFIRDLPIRKISGIGKVSECMLKALGIKTCTDLYNQRALLYHLYSQISFSYFMRICLGIGSTTVNRDSVRKSMSTERTFSEISKPSELYSKCSELCQALSEDLKEEKLMGKTVGIKLKTVNFEVKTRASTLPHYVWDEDAIYSVAKELLKTEIQNVAPCPLRLRLMGIRISSLLHQGECKRKQNTLKQFVKKMTPRNKDSDTELSEICSMSENPPEACLSDGELLEITTLNGDLQKLDNLDEDYSKLGTADGDPVEFGIQDGDPPGVKPLERDLYDMSMTYRDSSEICAGDGQPSEICQANGELLTSNMELPKYCPINVELSKICPIQNCSEVVEPTKNCPVDMDASTNCQGNSESCDSCTCVFDGEKTDQMRAGENHALNRTGTKPARCVDVDQRFNISVAPDSDNTVQFEDLNADKISKNLSLKTKLNTCLESPVDDSSSPGKDCIDFGKNNVQTNKDVCYTHDNDELSRNGPEVAGKKNIPVIVKAVIIDKSMTKDSGVSAEQGLNSTKDESTEGHQKVKGQCFQCPVCNDTVECETLVKFNQHIDSCLSKSVVKECSKFANVKDIHRSKDGINLKSSKSIDKSRSPRTVVRKGKTSGVTSKTLSQSHVNRSTNSSNQIDKMKLSGAMEHCKLKRERTLQSEEEQNNVLCPKSPEGGTQCATFDLRNSSDTTENLVCPVCFMEQSGVTLETFNSHVDSCLCKGTISEMLHEQNNKRKTHGKRLGARMESISKLPTPKRKRQESGSKPTIKGIDFFFQIT